MFGLTIFVCGLLTQIEVEQLMKTANFTFHGALNYFLPRRQKNKTITQEFDWDGSIKDMIESIAPPHPEIELLVVNGQSVAWDYIVQDNDIVDVCPDYDAVNLADKIRLIPPYQGRAKFILDTHLGKLAAYLRMMGFDTLYRNDYEDDVLAEVSHHENRILLTRDMGVLKRGLVIYGYFVRNTDPRKRILEISQRYGLAEHIEPFARCMKCNGLMASVEKSDIIDEIPEGTASFYNEFRRCQSCQQIYWKGSHHEKMENLIDEVMNS